MKSLSEFSSAQLDELLSSQSLNHGVLKDFSYKHRNPYHDRLEPYSFVLRDHEAEEQAGKWNQTIFQRSAPLHLEIGTGYGQFMRHYTQAHPEINFVGLDYRFKRSFNLVEKLSRLSHQNFRYLRAKGERLHYMFGTQELDTIWLFFPDPWPKTRQFKKRIFQLPFLEAAAQVLAPEGKIYVKTDHPHYAEWMREVCQRTPHFDLIFETDDLHQKASDHLLAQFPTKFEKIFCQQKINIHAFVLQRK